MSGAFAAFAFPAGVFEGPEVPDRQGRSSRAAPSARPATTFDPAGGTGGASGMVRFGHVEAPPATVPAVEAVVRRLRGAAAGLRERSVHDIVDVLGRTGERFLDDSDDLRREALEWVPRAAGLSTAMGRAVLDGMAADWTRPVLREWLEAEFARPDCLDGLVRVGERNVMAVGPGLCTQIVSGSVPGVGVQALLVSLMVKAPTLLKPGLGDVVLPVLFARGLREEDPDLADAVAVWYWPGGSASVEREALSAAEVAIVYGSDETVESLRSLAPATTRFVAHHHRLGVGVVGREALGGSGPVERAAADVATAVAMFDQRGCVCPHVVLVEEGAEVSPEAFARVLSSALASMEQGLPAGELELDEAAALQQLRSVAEMGAATGATRVHHGGSGASWTVIFEPGFSVGPPTASRAVRVHPADGIDAVVARLRPFAAHMQTVGHTGLGVRAPRMAEALGRLGASHVVPMSDVSFPRPWWMHDGRSPLGEVVRWVELGVE